MMHKNLQVQAAIETHPLFFDVATFSSISADRLLCAAIQVERILFDEKGVAQGAEARNTACFWM
jgi:hypothetical protein